MKVVFNTSPIIFLYKLGYLELARSLFDDIYIPTSVYTEIGEKEDDLKTLVEGFIKWVFSIRYLNRQLLERCR